MNSKVGKLSKQVARLETRIGELYEFTSLPLIAQHFSQEFAESAEIKSAATLVDHILSLALTLDLPVHKPRTALISILEEYVLKDRQGLRAALKALIDEACEEAGVCMVSVPSNFAAAPWEDIHAALGELALGYGTGPNGAQDERITNLLRLVDALQSGAPPRPLPGFMEMATALSGAGCSGRVTMDCRGRIDVRETYIEFHVGAFKGPNLGMSEARQQLRSSAALLAWAYRVLEPHIHTLPGSGRRARDVEAIGYAFTVGKLPPADSMLKLYDEYSVEAYGERSNADIAYRYFTVKPTGVAEHYAKL